MLENPIENPTDFLLMFLKHDSKYDKRVVACWKRSRSFVINDAISFWDTMEYVHKYINK